MSDKELDALKAGVEGATAGVLASFHELVLKLAGPAAEEFGMAWQDHVRVWRWSRALRLTKRVNEMLKTSHIPTNPISLKVLIPSLEQASLEDDDYLQDRWAALLANATDPQCERGMLPVFVEILKQLSPTDAHFLSSLYEHQGFSADGKEIGGLQEVRGSFTWWAQFEGLSSEERKRVLSKDDSDRSQEVLRRRFKLALENVIRLGLVAHREESRGDDELFWASGKKEEKDMYREEVIKRRYYITDLGLLFISSCTSAEELERMDRVSKAIRRAKT